MERTLRSRKNIGEYFVYGSIAAVLYLLPVLYLIYQNKYQNLYLLYVGNALFMAVIFYYNTRLISRPYEGKRAVSMLIGGHLATLVGTILSAVVVTILMFIFFPDLFSHQPTNTILEQSNAAAAPRYPSGFLFMILMDVSLGNASVGAFASILVSYIGKRNQVADKPANIEKPAPAVKKV